MRIKDTTVQKIKDAINIVDVVGQSVDLKRKGNSFWGLCPIHNDTTPSLCVTPSKNIWKCFACGKGGDAFTWLKEHDGLEYYDALIYLAELYHITLEYEEMTPEAARKQQERESVVAVAKAAQELFVENLFNTADALEYARGRGLTDETIRAFGLGYAFDYGGLSKKLIEKGFEEKYIIKTGLSTYNEEKHKVSDVFWKRLLFPFYNRRGEVIGYTGRTICNDVPKYKNTGETECFKKGNNIYGLYQASKTIVHEDLVYVVEGQMDVLSLYQAGIKNVVAGSGTAFTNEQRRLIHDLTNNVVFLYDGDEAGLHAAEKNLVEMIREGFNIKCVTLPEGKDPDDLVKLAKENTKLYLEKHEESYVSFLCKRLLSDKESETGKKSEQLRKVLEYVVLEPEKIDRDECIAEIERITGYKDYRVRELMKNMKTPEIPATFKDGLYGLQLLKDVIDNDENRTVRLTNDFEVFRVRVGEEKPVIFYHGIPEKSQIQELNSLAEEFIFENPACELSVDEECDDILLMKEMVMFGMTVNVDCSNTICGFMQYYVEENGNKIEESFTDEEKNVYILRCAEMAAYVKEELRITRLDRWAKALGTKEVAFRKLIDPYLKKANQKRNFLKQTAEVYSIDNIDSETIPDYVQKNEKYKKMLKLYKFYPAINKDGMPVCYMFQQSNGSFMRVADFFMEAMLHVYSQNKEDNKRIVRINSLVTGKSKYIEWQSSVFAKLSAVQEQLINEGKYNFTNGTKNEYEKIWTCMSYDFDECETLTVYGQQEEGCFCFSNGIFQQKNGEWVFEFADELGLMICANKDRKFYSPSFSKLHVDARKDNDSYEQDRWLAYTETPQSKRITFKEWAALMDEVYKINNNGKWAILYGIMSAFRSDIYKLKRLFTAIFLLGPTMSGKTQIAISIRSLFVKPEAPAFNLTSGTDAAFFSVMERFRDVPQVMEEYNDSMISDNKFQGLKSITYDGDGKQKRKSASSNDIETSKVNASVILLGQEAPQKDDNALSNRVILLEVPKRDSINDEHAKDILEKLKQHEEDGLSYLLLEILKLRPLFNKHYGEILRECNRALQTEVEKQNGRQGDQTRVIMTVSMILATCKLLVNFAPHLELPFTYDEMFNIAVEKVKWQVGLLVQTDKLAMFFNKFDFLIGKTIIYGRDFKIEQPDILRIEGKDIELPKNTKVLYFNVSNIHHMYSHEVSNGDHPLSLTTLNVNLRSSPAFISNVKATRFKWMESVEIAAKDVTGAMNSTSMITTREMKPQTKTTSAVVLNYDILKNIMQIDFERDARDEDKPVLREEKIVPDITSQQHDLPF